MRSATLKVFRRGFQRGQNSTGKIVMMPHRLSGLLIKRKAPTAPQKQTSRKREWRWGKDGILIRPDFTVSPWDLQLLLHVKGDRYCVCNCVPLRS
ncbi:hypothetical protein CDAR_553861 [Caerostris darwini]|uniref:Uncharacterized protein n=1 Tax=Caerostris darwini TaxID=1538125 RepID=A0AAV4WNG7_9ARAC|nr:hypothetical protein CDAR_553861 [Caerostris darwini]